ncbi:mannitol dehydrogenase family protein [Nocardiopsis sp. RSe5-2]|uniref:Mannitol dehydrogenase family protein n=1 Tax=Nocardiopsis endophytica TaxID=3018445 RepID=A0ABT4U4L7_9ACTN|nr:mannitol dehydrogenase family protein [Nocardiopsis endophytica]MDA2811892.1 mannitol dehydrogenase family protein [Nocardiopsis endophytica]
MSGRLDAAALAAAGRTTALDRRALRTGIVHLGVGAFFRAHGAVMTEDAMLAAGEADWGVCAVTGRSPRVWEQLAPQDGLFTVSERGAGARPMRVVSPVREVLGGNGDPWAVVERIADPGTRVVTLTVTEKGYCAHPVTGRLDTGDDRVRADLDGAPPLTPVGRLARGLLLRAERDAPPVTVVSCDNLPGNGRLLASLVADFAAALPAADGERLAAWAERSAAFPDTMVDRMVPATTRADLDAVERELGLRDEAAVVAEPFSQWVVEDRFAGRRPRWEAAGAQLVADVAPWEAVKLRVLNAGHSLLAYLGLGRGHRTIAACADDEALAGAVHRFFDEEVLPGLDAPEGMDAREYAASVLRRYGNHALAHSTAKVAEDGSKKLPPRLAPTMRPVLAKGGEPRWSALVLAAWMRHVAVSGPDLQDPLAGPLRAALPEGGGARGTVTALLRSGVLPEDLAGDERVVSLVAHWYRVLSAGPGALEAEMREL